MSSSSSSKTPNIDHDIVKYGGQNLKHQDQPQLSDIASTLIKFVEMIKHRKPLQATTRGVGQEIAVTLSRERGMVRVRSPV